MDGWILQCRISLVVNECINVCVSALAVLQCVDVHFSTLHPVFLGEASDPARINSLLKMNE